MKTRDKNDPKSTFADLQNNILNLKPNPHLKTYTQKNNKNLYFGSPAVAAVNPPAAVFTPPNMAETKTKGVSEFRVNLNKLNEDVVETATHVLLAPAAFILDKTAGSIDYDKTSEAERGVRLVAGATAAGISVLIAAPFAGMAALGKGMKGLPMLFHKKDKEETKAEPKRHLGHP